MSHRVNLVCNVPVVVTVDLPEDDSDDFYRGEIVEVAIDVDNFDDAFIGAFTPEGKSLKLGESHVKRAIVIANSVAWPNTASVGL